MKKSQRNRGRLGMLSLLAIPLVSLFGVASASAAVVAPSPVDGKIVLA